MSTDIQKFKGRLQLKNGAVPVNFIPPQNQMTNESVVKTDSKICAQMGDSNSSCTNCSALSKEIAELKSILFETQINADLNIQKERAKSEKLTDKCHEKSDEIHSLKDKVKYWKAKQSENEIKIDNLKRQVESTTNGLGLEVNTLTIQ